MNDIFLEWGSDLEIGSTGDLALATATDRTRQRVCRRLLTNPGDYIWQLDYGGGLGQFVGTAAMPKDAAAIVKTQLELEATVSQSPEPNVTVSVTDPANGYVTANITYVDASSGSSAQINISSG